MVLPSHVISQGYVAVRDGRVARVGEGPPPAARERHVLGEALILPGGIDGQVHSRSTRGWRILMPRRARRRWGLSRQLSICLMTTVGSSVLRKGWIEGARSGGTGARRLCSLRDGAPNDGAKYVDELVAAGACAFKFSTFGTDPDGFHGYRRRLARLLRADRSPRVDGGGA